MITPDTIGSEPPRRRARVPRWARIAFSIAGAFILLGIGASIGASSARTAAKPEPSVTVYTPGARVTVPPETVTAAPVTVTATPQARPGQVLLRHSGSGNWNSAPFQVSGDSPQLTVTYSYSGNGSDGSPDNFTADIENGSDDQLVANDIAWSGGKTTSIYPDTTTGGGTSYHLAVQATGSWTFTVTEAG